MQCFFFVYNIDNQIIRNFMGGGGKFIVKNDIFYK